MLHPTQLPDCAVLLNRILDFQENLLALGCSRSSFSPDDFKDALGEQAFKWLQSTQSTRKLFEPIYAFAKFSQEEKDAILADFQHDRQYIERLDDESFQFRLLRDVNNPNREQIKAWFINFYEQFAKPAGIGAALLKHTSALGKTEWWQAYRHKNGGRLTCSVCDGSMNHDVTVEHFLPKSKYPVLAVHPHNLLPVCDKCNNKKDKKDPLNGRTFKAILVPYREDLRSTAHLAFEDDGKGAELVRLVPKTPSPEMETKLSTLSELFDLPGQWQHNIHEIGEIAYRRVQQHFRSLKANGVVIDPANIADHLDWLCGSMEQDWGILHYEFPATEWLRWAKQQKLDAIYSQL